MVKIRVGNQIANLTPNHEKSEIALISLRAGGMLNTVGNLFLRAIILY
jgi:hypothetical protein